jgi:hypothetical protein
LCYFSLCTNCIYWNYCVLLNYRQRGVSFRQDN